MELSSLPREPALRPGVESARAVESAVRVERVSHRYGSTLALDGLDLTVRRGETFGLLGPNGAGKSTLMSLMSGVLEPDRGRIVLEGGGEPRQRATRARIGIAPQDLALYPNLSAEENLVFFARLYGLSRSRLGRNVERSLALAGLESRRAQRVRSFSGGMKRRLNLACAVVHEPEVVLLDEPTTGVDPQSRNHVFESLERLKSEGLTLVYSTHYMEEVERLCERVAIIDRGQVLTEGTISEIVARHGGEFQVEIEVEGELPSELRRQATMDGAVAKISTPTPRAVIEEVVASGLPLRALRVERANIETVFLALTGRSLRD